MLAICQQCGKEFKTYPSRVRDGKAKFCSKECYFASYTNKERCVCKNCGKVYYVAVSQLGKTYCSKRCMEEYLRKTGFWTPHEVSTCAQCGKRFEHRGCEDRKFCSHGCYAESMRIPKAEYSKNRVAYTKRYRRAHPEKAAKWKHKRRALKNGYGGNFTEEEWKCLKAEHDHTCRCGKQEPEIKLTVDHVIPLYQWGEWVKTHDVPYKWNDIENIQPLCGRCNSSKSYKLESEDKV